MSPSDNNFRPYPPTDTAQIYHLAAASRATRATALKGNNRRSFIGALVPFLDGRWRVVVFESRLELLTAYILLARPETTDLWDQPTPVSYRGADGHVHRHTFDYLVTTGGRRIAIAVKPTDHVKRTNFKLTLGLVKAQMGDFADDVLLVTEKSFSRHQGHNASLVHFISRNRDDEADGIVGRIISSLNGKSTIGDIVNASGLCGRGWRSVVRLSGRGLVKTLGDGRIDEYQTQVEGARIK